MSEPVIKVSGLGKQYHIGGAKKPYKTLRESFTDALSAPFRRRNADETNSFWALKDVNFEINRGEVVGIIGRNGAGKSTLLKILSRITDPTEGEIDITGRVGSLLEVGTGFHPELTGRENVYLNGAILGMKKADIAKKFDEIVAFAETEKFLDTPVKYYSSGMYTRLAFAVAAHLEPEILIVDEVLAVGDAQFQKKCMGKMSDVASEGRTVLFVSHNLAAVQNLCTKGIMLVRGRVARSGPIDQVVDYYQSTADGYSIESLAARTDRTGNRMARAERLELLNAAGEPMSAIIPGSPFQFRLRGVARAPIPRLEVSIDVDTLDGTRITTLFSGFQNVGFGLPDGPFELDCAVPELNLRPDVYSLNLWLGNGSEAFDFVSKAATVEVATTDFFGGGRIPDRPHGPLMARYRWTSMQTVAS